MWTVTYKTCLETVNKTIGLLLKVQNNFPRVPLVKVYKSFLSPYLHYGDISYDQMFTP